MITKDVVQKFVLLVVACSVLGTLFFLYLHYSLTGAMPGRSFEAGKLIQVILGTTAMGFMAIQVDRLLNRLLNWKAYFLLRFLTGFVINVTLAVTVILFVGTFYLKANVELLWKFSILLTISILVYEIFYGWFFSYRYYAVTQVEQLRGERWQLELQFESLKSQISPHYLFNCLNTISSLLYKDSHMAEEFIRRMADTFRYVMSNQKQKLVTLREEVEFVKAYYYLLQVRYEHHLRLEVNLPKNLLETRIPPMALQMLVENAVKHNAISKERPLLVYISAQDNTFITITSTKTVALQPSASLKVGLDNIRNRYKFFTEDKITIKDDEKFTVQLPVIRLKAKEARGSALVRPGPDPGMNRLFIHNAFFRLVSGLLFGVLVYLLILLVHNTVEDINKIFSSEELYVCIALSYLALESMRIVIRSLERRFKGLDFQQRLIAQVTGSLIASLGLISLAISAYYRWVIGFSIASGELDLFLIVYGVIGLLLNILYFSHYYLQLENKSQMDQEARLREKIEADFASFKSDINPDLLYESLENLILTVHHNAEAAEEQIDYLAGIYRYSLVHRHKEFVTLEEELQAGETLVKLLNFTSRNIQLHSSVPHTDDIHVIPGSLLVTLDSIVRNTLISSQSPLVLNLYVEEEDYLVVQHTLNDKLVLHTESLLAFARLQRSYSFFAEKPFLQIKAGGENYIKFPLVRIQQTTEPV